MSTQPILLLITTHPQLCYLIQRYGQHSGCVVIAAATVEAGLSCIGELRPAMVLLHLLPSHGGWSMLRHLREQPMLHQIPITIIAADVDEARARAEGAAYWLWQPVMYGDFQDALVAAAAFARNART